MYSTANGVKIYYEVSGEGMPFVMVHANPFDHNLWMYQIAHFSTYFKVIAIDIRGYGRSDKPETPFSLKDMAGDVLGVCRDEKVTEAILGGVSVGSGMAILLGLRSEERRVGKECRSRWSAGRVKRKERSWICRVRTDG